MPKAKLVTRTASTSSVSTDNIPKGTGLTNAELDSNFLNLRDQGWRLRADDSTQHTITADTQITFQGGVITADANGDITVADLGGGSTETSASVFTSFQVSETGASGTDLGNYMRVNSAQIDFNHQGQAFLSTAKFRIYGSDAQQANGNIPFEVGLSQVSDVRINEIKYPSTDGVVGSSPWSNGSGELFLTSVNRLPIHASTAMPNGVPGAVICISDNGYKPAYYDNNNWKYIHDNSNV